MVRLKQILSQIGSTSVVSRGYDPFVRPVSLCGETVNTAISASVCSVTFQRKQWFLTPLFPRKDT